MLRKFILIAAKEKLEIVNFRGKIASGIMEHTTKRLFFAQRNGGAFIIKEGQKTPICSSGKTELNFDTIIYIDEYFEINRQTFSSKLQKFSPVDRDFSAGSSAVHYVDVASGAADLALECTRKNNLEIAIAYGLEIEAGAVMVDLEGIPIGNRKYLQFGQKEKIPIITAATKDLAQKLLKQSKSTN